MQANPLKFIDDLKKKGEGYGWAVRIPAAPGGQVLRKQFLTRDHGSHREALQSALRWRDETCKALPFPIHARVSQYLDGSHKAIQRCNAEGKPLRLRAQWVEFDAARGKDRTVNVYRMVKRPEDFDSVYAELDRIARPRIMQEAERVARIAYSAGAQPCTPVPAALNGIADKCRGLFPAYQGGSLEDLAQVIEQALAELAASRLQQALVTTGAPKKGKGPAPTEVDTGPRVAGQRRRGGVNPSSAIRQTGTR